MPIDRTTPLPHPTERNPDPLYTAREACTYRGVSLRTFRTLTADGSLPVVDIRREGNPRPDIRGRLSELHAYADRNDRSKR